MYQRSGAFDLRLVPALGPDILDAALHTFSAPVVATDRKGLTATARDRLPARYAEASRDRFARYVSRPFIDPTGAVDHAALAILASSLPEDVKLQMAFLNVAATEALVAAFLEECVPDPGWRRFTHTGIGNWVARRRGQPDDTSTSRLLSLLRRLGYLRPFDKAWLCVSPAPAPEPLLLGILRDVGAPGRAMLPAIFSSATVRHSMASLKTVYQLLGWADSLDLIRWKPGEPAVWLPLDRLAVAERLTVTPVR